MREYVKMVSRLWGSHIAGPIAAILALILPLIGMHYHSAATVTILLAVAPLLFAVFLIWPAQYLVWKQEYDKHSQTKATLSELANSKLVIEREQMEATKALAEAQKAHTAELVRQYEIQIKENEPITKAFRAFQEKDARIKMGLEPESEEYQRKVWMNVLHRE